VASSSTQKIGGPAYVAWRSKVRAAYTLRRNVATGSVYVAIATTVTLHHIAACDQCNQTSNLCQNFEVENTLVGTGGFNGVIGPQLSEASPPCAPVVATQARAPLWLHACVLHGDAAARPQCRSCCAGAHSARTDGAPCPLPFRGTQSQVGCNVIDKRDGQIVTRIWRNSRTGAVYIAVASTEQLLPTTTTTTTTTTATTPTPELCECARRAKWRRQLNPVEP